MDRNRVVTVLAGHARDFRAVYRSTLPARLSQLFGGPAHATIPARRTDGRTRRVNKTTWHPAGLAGPVGILGVVREKLAAACHTLESLGSMRACACRLCRVDSLPRVCD